mgnify:CR=1 FL=1
MPEVTIAEPIWDQSLDVGEAFHLAAWGTYTQEWDLEAYVQFLDLDFLWTLSDGRTFHGQRVEFIRFEEPGPRKNRPLPLAKQGHIKGTRLYRFFTHLARQKFRHQPPGKRMVPALARRLRAVLLERFNELATPIIESDVPRLIAEVRRLREQLTAIGRAMSAQ